MKIITKHKKEIVFGSIVVMQFLAIFIYNLFKIKYQADYDSSTGTAWLAEVGRQKKLLIDHWEYTTNVGWDIPLILAVPLYMLTGHIFVSMGFANNLIMMVSLLVIWDVLKQYKIRTGNILIVLSVFLVPYTLGQLGYLPMMFTGTASYIMKALIPLTMLDVIVRVERGSKKTTAKIVTGVLLIFVMGLAFLTGLSSGPYLLICGLFPFVVYLALRSLVENDLRVLVKKYSLAVYAGILASAAGVVAAGLLGLSSKAGELTFVTTEKFASNALSCFVGIWDMFGGIREGEALPILSARGIISLCSICIASYVVWIILYYAVRVLRKKETRTLVFVVLCVQVVNLCVFLLANLAYRENIFESRYHIIPMVSAMLLTGLFAEDMEKTWNALCRRGVSLVLAVCVLLCSVSKFFVFYRRVETSSVMRLSGITEVAQKQDVDLIYFLAYDNFLGDGRILRVCDPEIQVSTLLDYNMGITWGASEYFFENSCHEGKIMAVVPKKYAKKLPQHMRKRMELVDTVQGYRLYVASENIFDCSTVLREDSKKVVDFPYSPNYQIGGEINDMGELEIRDEGGLQLFGPCIEPINGVYDITLNYETKTDAAKGMSIGKFNVYDSENNILSSTDIISGEEQCILKDVKLGEKSFHYTIDTIPNSGLLVRSIVSERISE